MTEAVVFVKIFMFWILLHGIQTSHCFVYKSETEIDCDINWVQIVDIQVFQSDCMDRNTFERRHP